MVRWGILGTGGIVSGGFLPALKLVDDGQPLCVGSRDQNRAEQLAAQHGISRAYASYHEVLDDEEVDAVYIGLPNHLHFDWIMKALQIGKKVILCEKPLTLTAHEARQVAQAQERYGALVWQAFAFTYHPQWHRVLELMAEQAIGDIVAIEGTFTTHLNRPNDIRWQKELGGGALYDVGCYPVHLAGRLLKEVPVQAAGLTRLRSGVDEGVAGVLQYPSGAQLILRISLDRPYNTFTRIVGTEGEIRLTNAYHPRSRDFLEWLRADQVVREYWGNDRPIFTFMLDHIHQVVAGRTMSRELVADTAVATAEALDLIRTRLATSG